MLIRAGSAHFWNKKPHVGRVMVKGEAPNGIELYDMHLDEDFIVSRDEYAACRNFTILDEALKIVDPEMWKKEVAMWRRAWIHCGIAVAGQGKESE